MSTEAETNSPPRPRGRGSLLPAANAALHGVFWILVAEAFFAVMRVSTRVGAARLPWAEVAAGRFLGGAVVVALVAQVRGSSLRVNDPRGTWMRSIFGTFSALGTFYALGSPRLAVGDAAAYSSTAPIFVALLSAPLLGERVRRSVWAGVALGFVGVLVLLRPGLAPASHVALLALAGAVSYAFAIIWLRRLGPRESSEAVALHVSLVGGATMLAIALPQWRTPTLAELGVMGLAALAGGLAQVAMTTAYGLDDAARLSAIAYMGVAFTYALEVVALGRHPAAVQLAGAATICLAGIVVLGVLGRRGPVPVAADEV